VIAPRLFLCSGAQIAHGDPVAEGRRVVDLDSVGNKPNVNIRVENVAKVLLQHLSPRLVDLLEIASYVYSADCSTQRGTAWTDDRSTEPWGRDFAFVIPVREPAFWNSSEITNLIVEVLNFLSNDKYCFTFVPLEHDRPHQEYLGLGQLEDWPFHAVERVIMFSGGLDSLAGAVDTARGGERLILVSHRPMAMLDSRQRKLFNELEREFPKHLIHIPVWINKTEKVGRRESTQRTRSFLYTALGAVVAQSVKAGGVRFFENGIVSLNFPVADEAIRARASRTTHPLALHLLEMLCSAVTDRKFAVDNPYIFKTKTDVATILSTKKAAHLIPYTCSCAHLMFKSKTQWHCGSCSQCIDRRFAITAAGLLAYDPEMDYVSDVFVGSRKDGPEKSMAVDYTRHGIELGRSSELELAARFNAEISRAVRYESRRGEAAQQIIFMHKRHGEVVTRVLREKVSEQAAKLVEGTLDASSLLSLVIGRKYFEDQGGGTDPEGREPSGAAKSKTGATVPRMGQPQAGSLVGVEEIVTTVLAKLGVKPQRRSQKRRLVKRDCVVFAAILLGLKGPSYCSFLQSHGIRPKWPDADTANYLKSYQAGDPWRKKIQDEKTRARVRMKNYARSELASAFSAYLKDEFDKISPLLAQLASRE
jgi:7-cyano-7-deazaguanine synthase in queuosine biosynthesis